jgi:hypothetical protein
MTVNVEGTVAYCSREDPVYPGFAACLARLAQRHPTAKIVQIMTNKIDEGRNAAVVQSEGDWLWFIDTDMLFAANTLERLLAHNVDLVQTLCLRRHPPHEPIMYEDAPDRPNTTVRGRPGLREVTSLGAGGTLYRRKVFESIPGPWFEGILGVEDTNFAQKARAAGFKMYVDTATPVGHTTPMVVWPQYQNGQWAIRYDAMNGQQLLIPAVDTSPIVRPDLKIVAR